MKKVCVFITQYNNHIIQLRNLRINVILTRYLNFREKIEFQRDYYKDKMVRANECNYAGIIGIWKKISYKDIKKIFIFF